jgi:uncharacterized protein
VRPFHIIVKPAGAACNLQCSYCFFLEKASLYPGSAFRMSDEALESCLRQVLEAHPGPDVAITWQGGEPALMGLPFFERVVELTARYRRPDQRVQHALQTNGILLDEAWCAFLARHGFLVGLSLDGPAAEHDAYRRDRGGDGTHARVLRAWERLSQAGADVNVLCAVHAANARHPLAVYRFFRDTLGARYIQFIPIVERMPAGRGMSPRSVNQGDYGRFMTAVFDEWVRRDVGVVFVQAFDAALASWLGSASLCVFDSTCGRAPVVEHNGDVYACDHFVDPSHLLGNLLSEPLAAMLEGDRLGTFGLVKERLLPDRCRTCDVLFACRGECPRNRFAATGGRGEALLYLCDDYRHFFHHVGPAIDAMAGLLGRERPAREAMPHAVAASRDLAQKLARAGRNDPCPCGSGLKVKRCHAEAANG